MVELTPRQREILSYIVRCQDDGWTPTVREIASEVRIANPNGVQDHLKALITKRFIERTRMKSRLIRVLDTGRAETIWGSFEL